MIKCVLFPLREWERPKQKNARISVQMDLAAQIQHPAVWYGCVAF